MRQIVEIQSSPRAIDRAHRVRSVADQLDCSERHVWRLIKGGKLRAERLSARCIRVFDSELARFRAAQSQPH